MRQRHFGKTKLPPNLIPSTVFPAERAVRPYPLVIRPLDVERELQALKRRVRDLESRLPKVK
jgi:hypothetical protein